MQARHGLKRHATTILLNRNLIQAAETAEFVALLNIYEKRQLKSVDYASFD
jgi:hypothetical protein